MARNIIKMKKKAGIYHDMLDSPDRGDEKDQALLGIMQFGLETAGFSPQDYDEVEMELIESLIPLWNEKQEASELAEDKGSGEEARRYNIAFDRLSRALRDLKKGRTARNIVKMKKRAEYYSFTFKNEEGDEKTVEIDGKKREAALKQAQTEVGEGYTLKSEKSSEPKEEKKEAELNKKAMEDIQEEVDFRMVKGTE